MTAGQRITEDTVLELIDRYFVNSNPYVKLGRGDDCAILDYPEASCISSDLFLEDVHFRTAYFTPEEIGYKSLLVNLSDLAGMGAKPVAFMLNLGLPGQVDMFWLDRFFDGMSNLAHEAGVMLAGGDLSTADKLHVSITIIGRCPENGVLLGRGGIMPGDALFVVGDIGLARIGLEELEKVGRRAVESWPRACRAHLRPELHLEAGQLLARSGHNSRPPVLMDVSDGLAADLPRLLKPAQGATSLGADLVISLDKLCGEIVRHADANGRDAVLEAYMGGEDYALLGACAPDLFPSLHAAIPELYRIGVVRAGGRIFVNGQEMSGANGFDHFRRQIGE